MMGEGGSVKGEIRRMGKVEDGKGKEGETGDWSNIRITEVDAKILNLVLYVVTHTLLFTVNTNAQDSYKVNTKNSHERKERWVNV